MLAAASSRAAADWRRLGARDEADARAFLVASLRRRWGVTAVRERARLLLARLPQVGRPPLPQNASAADLRLQAVPWEGLAGAFQDGALGAAFA